MRDNYRIDANDTRFQVAERFLVGIGLALAICLLAGQLSSVV